MKLLKNKWKINPPPLPTTNVNGRVYTTFEDGTFLERHNSNTNINNNTMFKNFELTWENAFLFLLWVGCSSLLILFISFALANKSTLKYSLSNSAGKLSITKEIDWSADEEIILDRTVSYEQAIKMVEDLNKTIK